MTGFRMRPCRFSEKGGYNTRVEVTNGEGGHVFFMALTPNEALDLARDLEDAAREGSYAEGEMPNISYEDMMPGELRLEFATRCQFHGCDAGLALDASVRVPAEFIRDRMLVYRDAIVRLDDKSAKDALVQVIEFRRQ